MTYHFMASNGTFSKKNPACFKLDGCNFSYSTEMRFDRNAINTNLIAIKFKPISKNIFLTLLLTFHELRLIPMNTDKISDAAAVVQLENVIALL